MRGKMTAAQREAHSQRMKAMWAKRRAAKAAKNSNPNGERKFRLVVYGYEDGFKKLTDARFESMVEAIPTILDLVYGGTALEAIRLEGDD